MTRSNIAIVLIVTAALVVIGVAQTRTQGQQGQPGRYQLLSAQYKWLATDAERKLVVDDQNQLFRIDTVTGDTAILAFRADQNSKMQSFWAPSANKNSASFFPLPSCKRENKRAVVDFIRVTGALSGVVVALCRFLHSVPAQQSNIRFLHGPLCIFPVQLRYQLRQLEFIWL